MPRPAADSDFNVPVEGIGTFVFGQRRMNDHMKINVEYCRIIDGVIPSPFLDTMATCLSVLRVLTVREPEGFAMEELDPLEESDYERLMKVHQALRDKEGSFRRGAKKTDQGGGQTAS